MLKLALGLIALNIFSTFNNINPIFHIDVDDSVVTKYYSFGSIPRPQDSNLGVGEFIEKADKGKAFASYYDESGGKVYSSFYTYVLYKYPNKACAIVEDLDSLFHDMDSGSSISISSTVSTTYGKTYSLQVSNSISKTNSISANIGANFLDFVKIGAETGTTTEYGFTKTENLSENYSKTISTSFTSTYFVNQRGLYRLTRRGLFDVYVIQKLVGINDVSYYSKDNVFYASSKFKYYTLSSYSYVLSYVNNSMYEGLTKYIENSDSTHSVDQDYVLSLFPSSNIVCID